MAHSLACQTKSYSRSARMTALTEGSEAMTMMVGEQKCKHVNKTQFLLRLVKLNYAAKNPVAPLSNRSEQ